ncbi:uncharacterized protein MELLADRAFT_104768 [Melampsora larici-populina 98AG31]|uniref:Uncharacterized protein n=1 Tax=Melampsora larici-populina (strain 98AG31 / pathotype 3-4-7) TaxID=747676 RepID=F4RFU7_MELLP|nr:uncharacterized protein MELLADRAFT_104768 [Melampsora larici-populina 98AG31]EGG08732.1 hypothetical protein MELLADRAFT_104768 [Melampsora larici-populina 98AG31]
MAVSKPPTAPSGPEHGVQTLPLILNIAAHLVQQPCPLSPDQLVRYPFVPLDTRGKLSHMCYTAERTSPYHRRSPREHQSPSLSLLLRSLNNHGPLANASGLALAPRAVGPGLDEGTSKSSQSLPNILARPSSPNGLFTPGSQGQTPEPNCNDSQSAVLGDEPDDGGISDMTRPLTIAEQTFLQGLCTKYGFDEMHQEYVQTLTQVMGLCQRHIALISSHMALLMEQSKLSNVVTGLVETVAGLADNIRTPPMSSGSANAAPAHVATPESAASTTEIEATTPWSALSMLLVHEDHCNRLKLAANLRPGRTNTCHARSMEYPIPGVSSNTVLTSRMHATTPKKRCISRRRHRHQARSTSEGSHVHNYQIAHKCGTTGTHGGVEALWEATDQPTRARVAYLSGSVVYLPPMKHREALRIFQIGKGSSSIWAAVDTQLEKLWREERSRITNDGYTSGDYTAALYMTKTLFQDMIKMFSFELPSKMKIEAGILPTANVNTVKLNEELIMDT